MTAQWKSTLSRLVKRPSLHARFINTISLMEYMGARKIVKSQEERGVTSEILAHITEEIRHAQVFKKMALKLSDGKLTTYGDHHLLAGAEGRSYIQSVDQSVAAALRGENTYLNYLLSTLLIEERANSVYPFYLDLLEPFGMAGPIRGILREEEHHLEEMHRALADVPGLDANQMAALKLIEEEAFQNLINAVDFQLQNFPDEWETAGYEFQN